MLVPIDLQRLAARVGYLSPELALGYRLGGYLDEVFCGLEVTRLAACVHPETLLALESVARWQRGEPVVETGDAAPYHVECYHPPTGTLLSIVPVPDLTALAPAALRLAPRLGTSPEADLAYSRAVDERVRAPTSEPSFCAVRESRCSRPRASDSESQRPQLRCRRCGAPVDRAHLWSCDGVLCCTVCAGLCPLWFDRQ